MAVSIVKREMKVCKLACPYIFRSHIVRAKFDHELYKPWSSWTDDIADVAVFDRSIHEAVAMELGMVMSPVEMP